MTFEKSLPEWNALGVEPPETLKNNGWAAGNKPPADYWNWHMNTTYEALKELQEKASTTLEVTEAEQRSKDYTDEKVQDLGSTITPEQIGAASKTEFDEHVNDTGLHVTAQKQQEWNNKANAVHQHAASDITSGTIATARLPAATTSAAGISKLNNSITSSSATEAAAAAAVKQVNDKFSNMIRVNNGKLEYYDGSQWKSAGGGGSTMMIGASDNVKKTYNFSFTTVNYPSGDENLKARSQKLFSYKFPGVGSYRMKVTGDYLNATNAQSGNGDLIIMPTPNQTTGSNYTNITLGVALDQTHRYFPSAFDPAVPTGAVVKMGTKETTEGWGGSSNPAGYGDYRWGNKYAIYAYGGNGNKVTTIDILVTNDDPYHFFVSPNTTHSGGVYYQIKKVEICYDEIG